ncbi:MAG: ATP-binding protein [Betaproteobacteria bacterium]|nr:ATP-binding protein [Betaproteobacteria bacterium]
MNDKSMFSLLAHRNLGVVAPGGGHREADPDARALRLSVARLNEAQRIARIGSWELDLVDGRLTWSDEIFNLFEIDKRQFGATYEAFLNAIHPEDRDAVNAAYTRSLETQTPYEISHRLLMADGRIKHVHEHCESDFDASGKPLRSVGTVQDISDLKRAEFALEQSEAKLLLLNSELEDRVKARTAELQAANAELTDSLERLRQARTQLVQSEKMAALGGLVAGVAHEINTPLGIGVTAASHLELKVRHLGERFRTGALSRADMEGFLGTAAESSEMVLSNLKRAAELIRSFKQVAVDQTGEHRRRFKLKDYLGEVLLSLSPQINRTRHSVSLECPPELELDGYPGSFSQIVTNLLLNSLLHGFDGVDAGHVTIRVGELSQELLLTYADDGRGIAAEHLPHVFEPFYTTKRGQGGSGLGLHIVYNIVTQKLGGSITCESSPGNGVVFEIRVPRPVPMRGAQNAVDGAPTHAF